MILAMIGTTELLLVGGLVLLLFGGKKLPEMMRGMGKGVRSFKEGLNESDQPENQEMPSEENKASIPYSENPTIEEARQPVGDSKNSLQ